MLSKQNNKILFPLFKYVFNLSVVFGFFSAFIACGADKYKAKVDEEEINVKNSSNQNYQDTSHTLYGIHTPMGWRELPIKIKISSKFSKEEQEQIKKAMTTWEMAVGKSLFTYQGLNISGEDDIYNPLDMSLKDGSNDNFITIDWDKTKKDPFVIAATVWQNQKDQIQTADIHYNNQYFTLKDSFTAEEEEGKEIADLQSIALHEMGHLLGLTHVDESVDTYSIMNSSIFIGKGLTSRFLSKQDIERLQTIYGCQGDSCNIEKTFEKINEFNKLPDFSEKSNLVKN